MSASRSRLREDVEQAYTVQTRSAIEGALHGGAVGVGLTIITHYTWPFFRYMLATLLSPKPTSFHYRRQTFQFKGFLVCACSVFGLVIGAERALQEY
ncbi:hypothetical protein B0H13DRAFT_1944878, partial [Mycena leptocephala]